MRTVRFLEGPTSWPFIRQSPKNDGEFGTSRFIFGPGPESTDWLVVLNEIPSGYVFTYPRERTIFLSGEPPSIRSFHTDYLEQFGTIVTTDRSVRHANVVWRNSPVPWHVGIRSSDPASFGRALNFAELSDRPIKTKLCSCICSKKAYTPGHRARLAFVNRLRREFRGQIDFFGRGFKEIQDKEQALAPYRYHIAIENSATEHYWTEKLADAYLRNCFPIYFGAPNVDRYFNPRGMLKIDIDDPDAAVALIARLLSSEADRHAEDLISTAKRQVMWDYNILAVIDDLTVRAEAEQRTLGDARPMRPEADFLPPVVPKFRKRALKRVQTFMGQFSKTTGAP